MASFDFPASPVNGAVYTLNGVSYVWNGYAWMQSGGAGDVPYLPLTGGTISGNLTVSGTTRYAVVGGGTGTVIDNMASRVKVWSRAVYTGGVPAQSVSFNVASIADTALGVLTANFTTFFASNVSSVLTATPISGNPNFIRAPFVNVGNAQLANHNTASGLEDPAAILTSVSGDLA